MPDTGPPWALPYPALSDEADASKYIGQLATATDLALDTIQASIPSAGASAVLPYRMCAGVANMPSNPTANTGVAFSVTFPVGRFTQNPMVTVAASSSGYGAGSIGAPTVSGMSCKYYNPSASTPSSSQVHYIAVQMTTTSGPG